MKTNAAFEEDGYTIVPAFIDAALVESTKKRIDARLAQVRSSPEFIAGAKGTINLPNVEIDLPEVVARLDDSSVTRLVESHLGTRYSRRISYRSPRPGHGAQTLHADWTGSVPVG